MIDEPSPPPVELAAPQLPANSVTSVELRPEGAVLIDLTQLVPVEECAEAAPDSFKTEILVCEKAPRSPRLVPLVGPVDDGFGSAIPRARVKLSDTASAEANLIKQGVGGIDADGAEVRMKIDF